MANYQQLGMQFAIQKNGKRHQSERKGGWIYMRMRQFPLGLYQKWLSEYTEKYPNLEDPWHKYQYLKSRAQAYLNSQEKQKEKESRERIRK